MAPEDVSGKAAKDKKRRRSHKGMFTRKCRVELKKIAVATSCRHIFCEAHSPKSLKISEGIFSCPTCRTHLKENFDVIEVDLKPCDQYKTMILLGQNPSTIVDICRRSIDFYNFQLDEEVHYYRYIAVKLTEKEKEVDKQYKKAIAEMETKFRCMQSERDQLKKECDTMRENLIISNQKLSSLEYKLQRMSISQNKQSSDENILQNRTPPNCRKQNTFDEGSIRLPRISPDSSNVNTIGLRLHNSFVQASYREPTQKPNTPVFGESLPASLLQNHRNLSNLDESFRSKNHLLFP